jgi:hypothetical protein
LTFVPDDLFELLAAGGPLLDVLREEHHGDTVLPELGEGETRICRHLLEKAMGHLHEHAGTVPGVGFTSASSSVIEA